MVLSTLLLAAETVVEEAPKNPILPVLNELFWGAICFFGLWALMKFVLLKPIVATMQERAAKVRDDLDQAERAERELESAIEQYERRPVERQGRGHPHHRGRPGPGRRLPRRPSWPRPRPRWPSLRSAAAEEVAAAKAEAMAQLRGGVAQIAVDAASAVVQKPLDPAAQMQVIEDYVNRAGSPS